MQDRIKTEQEKDAQWVRKGKKFKTKYFTALKDLFGEIKKDADYIFEPENCCPNRKTISNIK